jgi:PAS domain S-box-containing protein
MHPPPGALALPLTTGYTPHLKVRTEFAIQVLAAQPMASAAGHSCWLIWDVMVDTTQSKPHPRVLVVDDEQDLMLALVAALELDDYDVTGFASSPEALAALRTGTFDVLVTDMMMPELDGIGLLRAGLEVDPNLVALIMTGQGTVLTAVEALKLGAFDYILKPFNLQTLLLSLERGLELRRVRLENLQLREAVALYDLSQAVSTTLDAATVAELTATAARQQLGADEALVLTLAPGDDGLVIAAVNQPAAAGVGQPRRALVGQRVPLTEGIAGWIAQHGEPLLLTGPVDDPRFKPLFPRPEISCAVAVPMIAAGRVAGVLTVNALAPRRPFTPGQVKALSVLAHAGAAALENATLVGSVRASETRYRELIEHATDAIVTIDGQGHYIEANAAVLAWLGYTREELLGLTTNQVVAPDEQAQFQREVDEMRLGKSVLTERRLRRKDGTWLQVELAGRQLPDGNIQAFMRNIAERKQSEQALRESEARFAALFQASPSAISVTTLREGRFVDVNTEFERLMGYTRAEVLGRTADEVGTWADPSGHQWLIDQMAQARAIRNVEQRFRRKSGEVIDVLLSIERIELSGEPYLVGLVLDITDRKRADRALRDSEARFAALFQASPAAITLSTLDGIIVDVNREFERTMGYGRAEVVGKKARELGTWAMTEERERVMRLLAENGSLAGVEVHYRRKSGEIMPALSSFETVELAGVRYILTLALDITDRKRAEEQVRFQAGLLGAVGQAVIATDPQSRILYWNHMAEKMYGWTAEEALGQSSGMLVPNPGSDAQAVEILSQVRAGQTWSGESTMHRRDGSTFPALVTDTPFYDGEGALAGIIGMSTDNSERKQRERELEAIGQLSAALRAALTAEQIPVVILDQLEALFGTDAADLSLLDPAKSEMRVAHASGRWAAGTGTRTPVGLGIMGDVMATGRPYTTPDAASDPLFYPHEAAEGIRAVAVLPLIAHGQTIGSLAAGRPAPFSDGDLRLLASIADLSANALQRATLHEQTRLRADQLAGVNELARALAETLLLEQIYERLDAATRQMLPEAANVVISLYDPELRLLSDVYRAQDGRRLAGGASPQSIDTPALSAQAEVVRERRPVIINHAGPRLGTQSSVLAPLLAKGEVIGVLQAHSEGARDFGRDDAALLATVANTAAVAIENARLFAETRRRLQRLQALRTIDLAITSSMDSHISLRVLVDQAATHLGVDAVDVLLLDNQSHRLELAAGRGFRAQPPRFSLRVDEGEAGRAFMERRLLRVQQLSTQSTPSARTPWIAAEGFVAYFGMPLVAKGLVAGVLEVFHRAPLAPDAEWMDFLETLAEQAAIAVDNSGLFADLQRSNTDLELAYDTTLEGWSRALDLRDKETEGHTQRVTDVTERLARSMGLSEAELMQMRRGALLHDIGKMGIPDSILLKPAPLTADEWEVMRRHPLYAFELISPIAYLRPALDIPYCHHEKWDGTGYPRGLKGELIPLAARIFAVVDVWDALRSDRPYRPAWPEERVRAHIRGLSGTHFDPRVVLAFLSLPLTS